MPEYRVRVEIDVHADSHRLAACEAFLLLRAADCIPWCCDVKEAQHPRTDKKQVAEQTNTPWGSIDLETEGLEDIE